MDIKKTLFWGAIFGVIIAMLTFDVDVFDAISLKTCVEKRLTTGAPGPEQMKNVIAIYHKYLKKEEENWIHYRKA